MDTASQVLVATVLAVAVGLGLGVWAAESRTFSRMLRPVNDVLQTLPQLVYLIPLVYLMPVSVVPGVIAGVLYAFPVVVTPGRERRPQRRAQHGRGGRHRSGPPAARSC